MPENRHIAVIGAGLMGHGIALTLARSGNEVTITDPDPATLASALPLVSASLKALGATDAEIVGTQNRITLANSVAAAVEGAAFVFEATPQALELKQQILAEAERHAPGDAILASNTSVIQITAIMERLKHRERALGTLWWNPPHAAAMVEVIKTEWTDPVLADLMAALLAAAGKTPVMVEKDLPTFIGNRLKDAASHEAFDPMRNDVCSANVVDSLIRSGFGQRLENGEPMEDTDVAGTELSLDFHENLMYLSDSRSRQSPCLERLEDGRKFGMKTGQRFLQVDVTAGQHRARQPQPPSGAAQDDPAGLMETGLMARQRHRNDGGMS